MFRFVRKKKKKKKKKKNPTKVLKDMCVIRSGNSDFVILNRYSFCRA